LLNGSYEPKPVRRVEIPKPDGGVRKLGIAMWAA
jgi:RNA-directed DNA polymerase